MAVGPVAIDTNLLILLLVGSANPAYIKHHKRLSHYRASDYRRAAETVALFSDVVTLPCVLAEVSNLLPRIGEPARREVREKLRDFIAATREIQVPSLDAAVRDEFMSLGLTDAMLLHLGALAIEGAPPTLFTDDEPLFHHALALGHRAVLYRDLVG